MTAAQDKPRRVSYTAKEVAEMLGIPLSTLYLICQTGEMRCKRVGRRLYIPVGEPERFINS